MSKEKNDMRPLVTIQRVLALTPIPDADRIETATVLGWKVVVRKGEIQVGDKVVYFEIDSVIPVKPWNEFLTKGHNVETVRLRTVRLRKQISQGLLLPMEVFGLHYTAYCGEQLPVGFDLTAQIGVTQYQPPCGGGDLRALSTRPHWIPKTDEVRIQSMPEMVDQVKGLEVYITQKLDGSSMSIGKHPTGGAHISTRNIDLKLEYDNRFTTTGRPLLERLPEGYVVQGELCGPGIQANRMGLKELEFFTFNVIHLESGKRLDIDAMTEFCKQYDYKMVPLNYRGVVNLPSVDSWLELAENGEYPSRHPQEGIVVRCVNQSFSFKVISNQFLLKIGE